MRTRKIVYTTTINRYEVQEGKSLEQQLRDLTSTTEHIEAKTPLIFTERKDGTRPEFNIRTDYYDIVKEKLAKANIGIAKGRIKAREEAEAAAKAEAEKAGQDKKPE